MILMKILVSITVGDILFTVITIIMERNFVWDNIKGGCHWFIPSQVDKGNI